MVNEILSENIYYSHIIYEVNMCSIYGGTGWTMHKNFTNLTQEE